MFGRESDSTGKKGEGGKNRDEKVRLAAFKACGTSSGSNQERAIRGGAYSGQRGGVPWNAVSHWPGAFLPSTPWPVV